jgi:hypothetical protein
MSVVRVKRHRERFTVLSTATLRMKALSLKARGLWALCLSYPDDWEFRVAYLQAQSARDGRDAVQSALRELEAAGLAALETPRGADGRVGGRRWTIFEEPALNPDARDSEGRASGVDGLEAGIRAEGVTDGPVSRLSVGPHRRTGFPSDGKPDNRENRRTGNPQLRNNEQYEITSTRKTEQQQATHAPAAGGRAPVATPLRLVRADPGPKADAAVAVFDETDGNSVIKAAAEIDGVAEIEGAARELVRRGVEPSVAAALAETHGTDAVRQAVALYDERRRGPKPPAGPGWLVAALQRGFADEAPPAAPPLLSYAEMLRWCEANGGLHRSGEFEAVRHPGGATLFRRNAGDA